MSTTKIINPDTLKMSIQPSKIEESKTEFTERKKNIYDHIFYEFEMFIFTCKNNQTENWLKNAVMESNRIHMRCLIYFFRKKRDRNDDIIYSDIIGKGKNIAIEVSENCKISVDKLTAHLTLTRLENSEDLERECNSQTNIKSIIESIREFIKSLDNGKVEEEYKKDFEEEEIQERFKRLKEFLSDYDK